MTKRILALMLALLMLVLSLAACGKEETNKEENNNQGNANLAFTPDQSILDTVVMKIGDVEITYETYRFYYMSCRANYEQDAIAKTVKELQDEVLQELVYQAAVKTLADRYGAGLTEVQKLSVNTYYEDQLAAAKDYNMDLLNALALRYMTPKVYKDVYAFERYAVENVFNYCKNTENDAIDFSKEAVSAMLAEFDCAKMVFVAYGSNSRTEDAALKKVEGVLEKLAAGEDFVSISAQYSDLAEGDSAEDGFYFRKGKLDENVEKAYYELAQDEYTTEAIKTAKGYYVIYRAAEDFAYFEKELYPSYAFNEMLKACEESLTVNYTDFYNEMFDGKNLVPELAG